MDSTQTVVHANGPQPTGSHLLRKIGNVVAAILHSIKRRAERDAEGNVAVVRDLYASFERRDLRSILDFLSPNVEWVEPANPYNPAGGTWLGHKGFLDWALAGNRHEEILAFEPREFLVGKSMVGVSGHTKCMARDTGRTYETDFVHLVTFEDGKVVKFQEFFDTYAAGEAFRPIAKEVA